MHIKSSKLCENFFKKINESQDIYLLVLLRFKKLFFTIKLPIKLTDKNRENVVHRFGEKYLTNHFVKFLQD